MAKESDPLSVLISQEGIASPDLARSVRKPNDLINTSIRLFRFILNDDDPRWHVAQAWLTATKEARTKPIHQEAALLAIYLSRDPSYRNGYASFQSPENVRQLCRATVNLHAWTWLGSARVPHVPDGYKLQLARTEKITMGTGWAGITGCPEALYQLRMFAGREYIARVGFNVHTEHGATVCSITNMQGIPDGKPHLETAEGSLGMPAYNFLVRTVESMLPGAEFRGLQNPDHAAALYNTVFKHEGIARHYSPR